MMVAPAETTVRTTTRTNLADRFKSLRTHLLSFATLNVLHDVITAAASVSVRCRAILPRNFAQLSDAGAATPGCRP